MEVICPEDHFSHVFDEHFKLPMSLLVQPDIIYLNQNAVTDYKTSLRVMYIL
jgi:hypothetical protein